MNMFQLKRHCALFISLVLIFSSSLLVPNPRLIPNISPEEAKIISENADDNYVYFGRDRSNLYDIIAEISLLDKDTTSLVHELRKHIENGFSIGLYDSVIDVLEYAQSLLKKKRKPSKKEQSKKISNDLRELLYKVRNGGLAIDRAAHHQDVKCFETIDSLNVLNKALFNRNVRIGKNLEVDKNVLVNGKFLVFGKAHFKNEVFFDDKATFNTDVLINNNLTVDNSIITTSVVTEKLAAVDAIVDNLTVTNCIATNCINGLSMADVVIGAISVNDAFINHASIIDAFIDNASINDALINTANNQSFSC